MRYLKFFLIGSLAFSCSVGNSERTTAFYLHQDQDEIIGYLMREYEMTDQAIHVKTTHVKMDRSTFSKIDNYLITEFGLNIKLKSTIQPFIKHQSIGDCVQHRNGLDNQVNSCYLGIVVFEGESDLLKFSYSEEVIDGADFESYYRQNYVLVARYHLDGTVEKMIPENQVPSEILSTFYQ